jgi:hypothetical protein
MRRPGPDEPRTPGLRRTLWLVLPLCLLTQCLFDNRDNRDDRHAGTSTSVTNPSAFVTGFAILENGAPAAGADVTLRKPIIGYSKAGAPESRFVAHVIADSAGKFTVPLVFMDDVYMEIRQAPPNGVGAPPDSLEAHLRRWPNGLPLDGRMGTFRLQPPGTVLGRFGSPNADPKLLRWVGVRGTGNFKQAPDGNPFKLTAVPAGSRELVVVTAPDSAAWAADPGLPATVRDTLATGEVESGGTTDFGAVFYNDD